MAELKHTCTNDDGLRDVEHAPDPCIACAVRTIAYAAAFAPDADAHIDAALGRVSSRIAELEKQQAERGHLERGCDIAMAHIAAYGPTESQKAWLEAERARKATSGGG
jgi:hypothetical protein